MFEELIIRPQSRICDGTAGTELSSLRRRCGHMKFLLMQMLRQYYWLDDALNENLSRLFEPKITRSQSLVLVQMAIGINRPSVIAANIGMSRQSMTQLLNTMKDAGLIEMETDPDDRRAAILKYSEKSEEIRYVAVDILLSMEKELASRIGKRSFAKLSEILNQDWGDIPTYRPRDIAKIREDLAAMNDN